MERPESLNPTSFFQASTMSVGPASGLDFLNESMGANCGHPRGFIATWPPNSLVPLGGKKNMLNVGFLLPDIIVTGPLKVYAVNQTNGTF